MLEIGDSLGNDLGWGMARQLGHDHEVRLVQADKSSSGLLTPWFYDWAQKEKVLLAQYKPQLVIITFGANDEQNLKTVERSSVGLRFGAVGEGLHRHRHQDGEHGDQDRRVRLVGRHADHATERLSPGNGC